MKIKLKTLVEVLNESEIKNIILDSKGNIIHIECEEFPSIYYTMTHNFGKILEVGHETNGMYIYDGYVYHKEWVERVIKEDLKCIRITDFSRFYNLIGSDKLYCKHYKSFLSSVLEIDSTKRDIDTLWMSGEYYEKVE